MHVLHFKFWVPQEAMATTQTASTCLKSAMKTSDKYMKPVPS